jgi:hypothetical protein
MLAAKPPVVIPQAVPHPVAQQWPVAALAEPAAKPVTRLVASALAVMDLRKLPAATPLAATQVRISPQLAMT